MKWKVIPIMIRLNEYPSLVMYTMRMTTNRHNWYILIINLGAKIICRATVHSLNSNYDLRTGYIYSYKLCCASLFAQTVSTGELCRSLTFTILFESSITITDNKNHISIINIHSHMNSHIWFIRIHVYRAVHEPVFGISDYDLLTAHTIKLFRS